MVITKGSFPHEIKNYDSIFTKKPDVGVKTQDKIAAICDEIKMTLISKNRAYGNSALDPVRIFSKSDTIEQLRVRLDDKLSRIQKGHDYGGEDTLFDLIGYEVLLLIAIRENNK